MTLPLPVITEFCSDVWALPVSSALAGIAAMAIAPTVSKAKISLFMVNPMSLTMQI
jgi:hypothetical protein